MTRLRLNTIDRVYAPSGGHGGGIAVAVRAAPVVVSPSLRKLGG